MGGDNYGGFEVVKVKALDVNRLEKEYFRLRTRALLGKEVLKPLSPEDRVRKIEAYQEGLTPRLMDEWSEILNSDPTPNNQYTLWIMKMVLLDKLRFEDLYKVKEDLELLANLTLRKKLPVEQRDVNNYKSPEELYLVLKPFADNSELMATHTNSERKAIAEGAIKLYENDDWMLYVPKTHEASCALGKGTRWCTTGSKQTFESYVREGALFILLNKKDPTELYQLHFGRLQFADSDDLSVPVSSILKEVPDAKPVIYEYLKGEKLPKKAPLDFLTTYYLAGTSGVSDLYNSLSPAKKKDFTHWHELYVDSTGQAYFAVSDWSDSSILDLFESDHRYDYEGSAKAILKGNMDLFYNPSDFDLFNFDFDIINSDNLRTIEKYLKESAGVEVDGNLTGKQLERILGTEGVEEIQDVLLGAFARAQESADEIQLWTGVTKEIEKTISKPVWIGEYLAFPINIGDWLPDEWGLDEDAHVSMGGIIEQCLEDSGNKIAPYNLFEYGYVGDVEDVEEYFNEELAYRLNEELNIG